MVLPNLVMKQLPLNLPVLGCWRLKCSRGLKQILEMHTQLALLFRDCVQTCFLWLPWKLCWSQGCCLMNIHSPGKVIKLPYKSHRHKFSLGFSSRNRFGFHHQMVLCESFQCLMVNPFLFIRMCSTFLTSSLASFPAVFLLLIRSTRLYF